MSYGQKTVSLTGSDTLIIGGRVISDVADGSWAHLTYPNTLVEAKTGKNGNSIYALNSMGLLADVEVRVIRASDDDIWLNAKLAAMKADFSSFVLFQGQMIKRVGDGMGNLSYDTYLLDGGVFSTQVEVLSNAEGNTDQSVSVYKFRFTNADRATF